MAARWTPADMPDLQGKTILITGANSGIGYAAAEEFARQGAHVVLACRSGQKGAAALERLQRAVPAAKAEVALLDVASLASVQAFAEAWDARQTGLDVLVNNAGVMALPQREITEDGFERQFATNHLGHFALTGRLLPSLQRAPAPRVVTVASLAHRNGRIDWDNLQSERTYDPMGAYNNTKLANLLFSAEFDRRLKVSGSPIVSVAAHPGVAKTNVFENGPGKQGGLKTKVIGFLIPLLAQDDKMGALPTEYAASAPDIHGGEYIGPDGFGEIRGYPKEVQPRANAQDAAAAAKLWQVSEELTGVRYP